jgi:hypothetical protein
LLEIISLKIGSEFPKGDKVMLEAQQVRQMILNELPKLMQNDTAFRESVISIARFEFADKAQTDSRFDKMMAVFERLMDEERQKWVEYQQKLDRFMNEERQKWDENQRQIAALSAEHQKKWDENQRQIAALSAEHQKKWDENQRQIAALSAEHQKKWDENQRQIAALSAEHQKKWDENQRQIAALNAEIKDLNRRLGEKIEQDRQKWLEYGQKLDRFMDAERQKWDENQKKWDENQRQISALNAEIKDLNRRLGQKIEQDQKKWDENQRKWEENQRESERKWEEQQKISEELSRRVDQRLGALGSRWGSQSEASFREALAGILKDFKGVEVINVVEWDDTGAVFGHPDQVELDIIIKNGVLIVCELKSSVSKSDMYIFERKVRFYEQKHAKSVNRMFIISPFVDKYAMPVADKLGIEVYSYADDVNL